MSNKKLGKTDIFLPPFSIGTATFGNVYGKMDNNIMKELVKKAIENDLNYFDTSPYYGNTLSEINLGKALEGIPKDKFIISTKVGRYGDDLFDFSESTIKTSINLSLERLKLDYVDILLLHDIEFGDIDQILNETLPALQKIKQSGKARYIGFSCYPIELIKRVIEKSKINIDVILSYAHCCLLNNKLECIIPFLKKQNIGIINASPLCMGLLSSNSLPDWHPASYDMIDYIKQYSIELYINYNIKIENYALNYVIDKDVCTTLVGIKTLDELNSLILIQNNKKIFSYEAHNYINNKLLKYHNIELG